MIICFYWSLICVYLVTMAWQPNSIKAASNQLNKMGENSFLDIFAQILFTQVVYGR